MHEVPFHLIFYDELCFSLNIFKENETLILTEKKTGTFQEPNKNQALIYSFYDIKGIFE